MLKLTEDEREELLAIAETTAATKRPTFIHVLHRKTCFRRLVRHRLVTWKKFTDGTFGPQFRSVELTDKGRSLLVSEA